MPDVADRSWFLSQPRSREALDRDYRTAPFVASVPDILADWRARTIAAKHEHPGRLDDGIAYGPHPRERIDFYRPDTSGKAPLLVFIHGGFWSATSREEYGFIATPWTRLGINVAVLDYALAPEVTLTTITEQALRGLAFLHAAADRLGARADRIVVAGHSAGAHLAAMSQVADAPRTPIAGLVLISGVFDLRPIAACYVGDTVRITDNEVRTLSPAWRKPGSSVPTQVVVGENEPLGFHEQSRALSWAWRDNGCDSGMILLPDRTHFSILDDLADPDTLIGRAIRRMVA